MRLARANPPSCSEMLRNLLSLSDTELRVYKILLAANGQRVSDVAKKVGRDRSSVQRSLGDLLSAGLITRDTERISDGGYYYTYFAVPPAQVKKELERCIDDWHEAALESLDDFEQEMEGSLDE